MNGERAEQILHSENNIPVYYKNTPVWIRSVDVKEDRVRVKNLNTDKDIVVSAKTLSEV